MQKIPKLLFFLIIFLFILPSVSLADSEKKSFITIVNPVRGRNMWSELDYLKKQAESSKSRGMPATWLLQYNTLTDTDLIATVTANPLDEIGVFLEVSEDLATDARIPYPIGHGDWAHNDRIFFSAYSIPDRRKLADTLFEQFKKQFGYYPKSVGAWYIDAVTLSYLQEAYGIVAAIDCADQYSTDGYEIWGKPWGVPYYPSKWNTLIPAQTLGNKLPVVKIQWALREPNRAYGKGVLDSTFSLQANDYSGHQKLNTSYFQSILAIYTDTLNEISQATVGLEVGTESQFLDEFDNQIAHIANRKVDGVQIVTMSEFANLYKKDFPNLSHRSVIFGEDALWYASSLYRVGLVLKDKKLILRDYRLYDETFLEDDSVDKDDRRRLYRDVLGPIDDLLYSDGKVLSENVENFNVSESGGDFLVNWMVEETPRQLKLTEKEVFLDGKVILDGTNRLPLSFTQRLYKKFSMVLAYVARLPMPKYYPIPVRFTTIGKKQVVGLQTGHEEIFAISFPPFHIGSSHFPFQNLIRFRTWPYISLLPNLFASDSSLYADWFLKNNKKASLKIFLRTELSLELANELTQNGFGRVFENSLVSIWQNTSSTSN